MKTLGNFIKKAEVEDALATLERAFRFHRRNLRALLRAIESEDALHTLSNALEEIDSSEKGATP